MWVAKKKKKEAGEDFVPIEQVIETVCQQYGPRCEGRSDWQAEESTQAKLGAKIANVFAMERSDCHLITHMLKDTAIDLMAVKGNRQEHREG
jgi:hypothetical protein